eukprot:7292621-Alexandrium_andersonii.AAC.1
MQHAPRSPQPHTAAHPRHSRLASIRRGHRCVPRAAWQPWSAAKSASTVSYTHLTLPTICSV